MKKQNRSHVHRVDSSRETPRPDAGRRLVTVRETCTCGAVRLVTVNEHSEDYGFWLSPPPEEIEK